MSARNLPTLTMVPTLTRQHTLNELSFKKYLREQEKINKAFQIRHQLEEATRLRRQEASINNEKEAEERLKKIEEIKRKRKELLEQKRQKELDISFTKDRMAIKDRKMTGNLKLFNEKKRKAEEEKERVMNLMKEREILEARRFSIELADRAVLISYQRLPTVLNLLRTCSRVDD